MLPAQLKFIYSEKATKILRNLPLNFDYSTHSQKLGEDFAKFCGLLRIYELYIHSKTTYFPNIWVAYPTSFNFSAIVGNFVSKPAFVDQVNTPS